MFVLDTNVVSELRKAKSGKANLQVVAWMTKMDVSHLYLSAISIMELEMGVLQITHRDMTQGAVLRRWLDIQVLPAFAGRVLPVDATIAQCCARLHVPNPCSERDALIAATALVHEMTVVTRNIADFQHTGVKLLNPWQS